LKPGIHPWRENFSSVPVVIEGEHLPTEVGYDAELQSGQDPGVDDEHADGLRLWGQWDVLPKSLKLHWRWLMVEKWTLNYLATALVAIPAVSLPCFMLPQKLRYLWHYVVTKLHILE
jgi:hypothetical protein